MNTRFAAGRGLLWGVWLGACGPDDLAASRETEASSESESETGEPEPLEPDCELEWEWRHSAASDEAWLVITTLVVDAEGNVYAGGGRSPAPGLNVNPWLGKWGPDGTQLWTRTFEAPPGFDTVRALVVGPDDGLFVLAALWFARIEPETGDELWSQSVTETAAVDIARTPDDRLVLLAETFENDDIRVWLSERDPVDGSAIWTRSEALDLGSERRLRRPESLGVGDDGQLWVSAEWDYRAWQGDFSPQGGEMLLRYDALGELLAIELSEAGEFRAAFLFDGSPDAYVVSRVDPDDVHSPIQLESLDDEFAQNWALTEPEWTVGAGKRELIRVARRTDGRLDIAGFIRDFPEGGMPLWTASVGADSGALTRGCVHRAYHPDSGEPLHHRIHAADSDADGFVVSGAQQTSPGQAGEAWLWLARFSY